MRIAQVAPLCESVPPAGYGGTERVVSWLTEALVELGHDVTLFASGDSETRARLVPACDRAVWHDPRCRDPLPHHLHLMELVLAEAARFDVIHFHTSEVQFPILRRCALPNLTTLHGALDNHDTQVLLAAYPELPLVSISMNQRRPAPDVTWVGNVHHGLPEALHHRGDGDGGYLAFIGRIAPEKRLDRAIEIARRTGQRLAIAARTNPADRAYHDREIAPLLARSPFADLIGEIGGEAKDRFLGDARALLFPIDWEEPFGLVMIEAMACGTPVIAWRRGSAPEVIEDGVTGFLVDDLDGAVAAVGRLDELDRTRVRARFLARFDALRMARDYVEVYEQVRAEHRRQRPPGRGHVVPLRSVLP